MQGFLQMLRDWFNSNTMVVQILLFILIMIIALNFVKKFINFVAIILAAIIIAQIYFNMPIITKVEDGIFIRYKDKSITIPRANLVVQKIATRYGNDYIVMDAKNPKTKMEFRIRDNLVSKIFDFLLKVSGVKTVSTNSINSLKVSMLLMTLLSSS